MREHLKHIIRKMGANREHLNINEDKKPSYDFVKLAENARNKIMKKLNDKGESDEKQAGGKTMTGKKPDIVNTDASHPTLIGPL